MDLMKSDAIKERHRDEYARITDWPHASAPGVFFWAGEHVVLHGFPAFCQQVPLRVWVAMRWTPDDCSPEFEFLRGSQLFYDPVHATRGGRPFNPIAYNFESSQIADVVERLAIEAKALGVTGKFKIRSLHELRPGAGCNWSGAFASALLGAFLASVGALKPSDLAEQVWSRPVVVSKDAPNGAAPNSDIAAFHRTAWKLETLLHKGRASGYGTLCSVMQGKAPLLFCGPKRGWPTGRPIHLEPDQVDKLEHLPFYAADTGKVYSFDWFDERAAVNRFSSELPVTCGLVYSGVDKVTGEAIEQTEKLDVLMERETARIVPGFDQETIRSTFGSSNAWLEGFLRHRFSGESLRHNLVSALAASTLQVGGALIELLTALSAGPARSDEVHGLAVRLASAMRRTQGGLDQLDLDWSEARRVTFAIDQWAIEQGCLDITAAKMTGGGRGGMLVFLTKDDPNLDDGLMRKLGETFQHGTRPHVAWISSRDGFDGAGLRVGLPGDTGVSDLSE